MNRWQTLTTEIVPLARGIVRIYISTNCVWLCILCGYLSDGQGKWSACSRLKFMGINGWGGRLSIWWGLGLWGSGLKRVCKCGACLQKFSLWLAEQVCESHVHVCPVWGLKASPIYSVFRGKFSPRLYWMLQSHTTMPVKPFNHWQKHCTSLSLWQVDLWCCSCMSWIEWKQALEQLCAASTKVKKPINPFHDHCTSIAQLHPAQ